MIWLIKYHRALIGIGAILALFVAFRIYVNGQVEQARLEDAAAVQRMDAIADDAAGHVAATEQAKIEKENADVRREALGSDDPLKSGLDRMRTGKTSGG